MIVTGSGVDCHTCIILYLAFSFRSDGNFVVHGVPSGSYIVEIANPNVLFEALRVDITSKGKMRARRVNFLQPNQVKAVSYPLEFRERGKPNYFHKREQWRITDFLFNPMVGVFNLAHLSVISIPIDSRGPIRQSQLSNYSSVLLKEMENFVS